MNKESQLHIFGEVLFDHFPDGSRVLGGAPFNVAWHLQAFGQYPQFISRIGDDDSGNEIVTKMENWGMSRHRLQSDPVHPTGSVRVLIQNGEPHYEIVADSAYDFIDPAQFAEPNSQGILYHGSLAIRNPVSRAALDAAKARHQGKIFIDVNLRPPWWERETLLRLLHDADWVKLNEDELAELSGETSGLESAMRLFSETYDLDTLVVTRGVKGAVAWSKQQQWLASQPPEKTTVVDTVGAGDAFSAVLLLGLNRQWPLATTLERAQTFASAIVGRRGATVDDIEFYHALDKQWQ